MTDQIAASGGLAAGSEPSGRVEMNNYALMAALGSDAVAAVHGYRLQVISEAEQRGLRLVREARSDGAQLPTDVRLVDPLDIRLTFLATPGRTDLLAGRLLRWCPAQGWSLSCTGAHPPFRYYAGLHAAPLHLVPAASEVLEWATGVFDGPTAGHSAPPKGVELDDDPEAIQRLLSSIDRQHRVRAPELFSPAGR
jgi:hypothetical protein